MNTENIKKELQNAIDDLSSEALYADKKEREWAFKAYTYSIARLQVILDKIDNKKI